MNLKLYKNKFRNALIILHYLTGLPFLRYLFYRWRGIPLVRILCWHKVPSKEQFRHRVSFLANHYHVVSLGDFIANKNLRSDRINLVFSFDDGYKSWMENAAPVLLELGLPAIFFISSGYLDLLPKVEKQAIQKFKVSWAPGLSMGDVRSLGHQKLFTIGAHGRDHRDLTNLKEGDYALEIESDRQKLEEATGGEILYFAFPFGHRKNFHSGILKYYPRVFSIIPGFNRVDKPGPVFHRDSIDLDYPDLLYKAWLMGAYDFYWRLP